MHWGYVRHVPVEDDVGHLVDIIFQRFLLELFELGKMNEKTEIIISDVMKPNPITISPETPTLEALIPFPPRK